MQEDSAFEALLRHNRKKVQEREKYAILKNNDISGRNNDM